jgi:hypothetical protein
MPKQKRKRRADENGGSDRRVAADEKIARLLGLLLVKDIKKKTDRPKEEEAERRLTPHGENQSGASGSVGDKVWR